jgi:hypothetical protein
LQRSDTTGNDKVLARSLLLRLTPRFNWLRHIPNAPIKHADIRRVPVRRFPYCVFYRVEPDRIVVLAIFHGRRNPRIWQARA